MMPICQTRLPQQAQPHSSKEHQDASRQRRSSSVRAKRVEAAARLATIDESRAGSPPDEAQMSRIRVSLLTCGRLLQRYVGTRS